MPVTFEGRLVVAVASRALFERVASAQQHVTSGRVPFGAANRERRAS